MEWLAKKSQVLGEIGRHHSVIGLREVLLNPHLDGRSECETWSHCDPDGFLVPLMSVSSSFSEEENRKMRERKTQFLVCFVLSNQSIPPLFYTY